MSANPKLAPASRAERAAEAAALKAEGLNGIQIGQRMGISRAYAYELLADPDGSDNKRRKESYRGTCCDCGKPTNGSDGPTHLPERCVQCANIANGAARKVWTREAILTAIREWADEYGDYPGTRDWSPFAAREINDELRARRFEALNGRFPGTNTVIKEFGTWNAGIEAAGFAPRQPNGGGENVARRRSMRAAA